MSLAPVHATRAAYLLVRLRLLRLLNILRSARRRKVATHQRAGTPPKAKLGWLTSGLVSVLMVFAFTNLAITAMANIRARFGSRILEGAALEMALLFVAALLVTLGSKEFAQPEWDLEWLFTLPMKTSTLVAVRVVERTIVNPAGLLSMMPFSILLALECRHGVMSFVLGPVVTVMLLCAMACVRTLIDTGLRLSLSPPRLRNLQAVISISGVIALYVAMSVGVKKQSFVLDWSNAVFGVTRWLPTGLAVRALSTRAPMRALLEGCVLVLEIAGVLWLTFWTLAFQLRHGVATSGGRESGLRGKPKPTERETGPGWLSTLSVVQLKELRLLARDRNFFVQTMVLPLVIVGAQAFFNVRSASIEPHHGSLSHFAAIAFVIAAYTLLFSAFQTLNAEGQALWILYTVPRSLASILREKAVLWGAISSFYALCVLVFGLTQAPAVSLEPIGLTFIVLLGVPIYSVIAVSLGVFACDPLAQEVQRRVRSSYLYLYMLLSSLYVYAIYASSAWQRTALLVLTALLALSLWQKASDHFPYLLDPTASPPPRVSLSDGLIATMVFFVMQALTALIQLKVGKPVSGTVILTAFAVAGAFTFGVVRLIYMRSQTSDVPKTWRGTNLSTSLTGLGFGIVAACLGGAYMYVVLHFEGVASKVREQLVASQDVGTWLIVLAVVAAPLFEEFIFRGLVFGGLRRTVNRPLAVIASAGIFAIVHPPISVVPVFFLGACAALAYERTKVLSAPMLTHALYNASILGFQLMGP